MILLTAYAGSDNGKRTYRVRGVFSTKKMCEQFFTTLPESKDEHIIHLVTTWKGIKKLQDSGNQVLIQDSQLGCS